MFKHSVAATASALASLAFPALVLIAAPAPASAAEINLLAPVSFRVLFPKLLPEFEQSSGHKVMAAYAPLGIITERVIKGEPVDVPIVSDKQNEELQKQGKLLAGSRVEIAQVGFTVFVKQGAAKPDPGRSPELFLVCGRHQLGQQASRRGKGADRLSHLARGQAVLDGQWF
jgi:molybdate transport system substrate-binding protein